MYEYWREGGFNIFRIGKKIVLFAVVLFFLNMAFLPLVDAETPLGQEEQLMTVWLPGVTQDDYMTQVTVSDEQYQTFKDKLANILVVINTTITEDGDEGVTITETEWKQIFNSVDDFIDAVKSVVSDFPDVDIDQIVLDTINAMIDPFAGFLHPAGIISAGIGFSIIPFYGYESFVGLVFRPIFSRYVFGFSRIGGLLSYHRIIGRYNIFILRFSGLFINFGDIGFDKIIGPQIYIGRASFGKSVKL